MNTINNSSYVNKTYDKNYSDIKTTNTLSAIISTAKDNNKYNLKFSDNTSLNVDKDLISGNIGDKINVKVEEKNGTKTFISQVLDNNKAESTLDMLQKSTANDMRDDLNYISFLNENGLENTAENAKTVRDIKAYINSIINSGGEVSVAKLMSMGIDIGNLSLDALSRLIYEANTSDLTALNNKEEDFSEFLNNNPEIASDSQKSAIAKALFEQGLPINDSNMDKMEALLNKAENLPSLDNSEIISLLKQNSSLSVDNIYKAGFNHSNTPIKEIDDKIWNELKAQVENIFSRDNIEPTEEHFEIAKSLIANEVALNGENINKVDFLKEPKVNQNQLLKVFAEAISKGEDINTADILGSDFSNSSDFDFSEVADSYLDTIKYINQADEEDIQKVIDDNKELNLKNIITEAKNSQDTPKAENISQEAVTAKRQLLEIQLKLTSESAARLCQKGIDINTEPLKEAINQLKAVEKELYSQSLQNAGAEVNAKSVDILTQSVNKVNSLALFMNESSNYSLLFNKATAPTLDEVSTTATNSVLSTLEALATTPSQKFGDSFSQVKGQLESILSQSGIPVTEENLRAAEILSRNGIDITEENILKIKVTDTKLNTIYDKLHPMTIANMIKEGINPLNTGLDDIIDYIQLYSTEYEQENREKIAEYIMEADENKALSEEERTAVASVYKALSYISKGNSKAVGSAVFAENSATIGDILDMAKAVSKAKMGIDKTVNDNDNLKVSQQKATSIENTIQRAINADSEGLEALKAEYSALLQDRIVDLASPDALVEFIKGRDNSDISKATLEELYSGLEKISKSKEDSFISKEKIQQLAEDIQKMDNGGRDIVTWLNENNIPLTLNNINNMAKLLKDAFSNGKELDELKDNAEEENISVTADFGYNEPASAVEDAKKYIEDIEDSIYDIEDLSKINLILKQSSLVKKSLSFKNSLNENSENYYQIPIRLKNNKVTDLNMYLLNQNNDKNSFQGFLNLETDNLGIVQGYISVEDNNVKIRLNADNADSEGYLKDLSASLYDSLSSGGFDNIELAFGEEKPLNIFNEKDTEEIIQNLENSFTALI